MADQEMKNGSIWIQAHILLSVNITSRTNPIPGKFTAFPKV